MTERTPDHTQASLSHAERALRHEQLFGQLQRSQAKLPSRLRQLAIMRSMWLCGAPYQWGEHLARTKNAGVSDEEIELIKEGSCAAGWSPQDQAILSTVEEFRTDTFVSDATWGVLSKHLDEKQRLELLVLIGPINAVFFRPAVSCPFR